MSKVLIVDDEQQIRSILALILRERGFEVAEAESGDEALRITDSIQPDIVLLDINLPGTNGLETLRQLLAKNNKLTVIMMTAYATIRSAVEAIREGAFDYLTKPFDNDELLLTIDRALALHRLSNEVEELRAELSTRYGFNEIVGISPRLQGVFRTITKVAAVDATVLIEGESGTGKELVARAIHRRSHRAGKPFVAVNCGAIPPTLFEAEFFGHQRGAFTDAHEARSGRFEQAQGGTLFLDEISDLSLEAQVKLLRALQEREVTRLGSHTPIKVDVRVVTATNKDLKAAVESGAFRQDLYWRLNVVKITLPSLRERSEDVPLIVDHLLARFSNELGVTARAISPEALRLLQSYQWPGNIRELENTLCSAMIMCDGKVIKPSDLPPRIRGEKEVAGNGTGELDRSTLAGAVRDVTENIEKMLITSRLAEMNYNRTATADSLGISRKTLFNKMRQYGLGPIEPDELF
ncbi:MAG TPA: sigma-54 dependent transcriptional regulator [Pyrinomonadaceae bacterium]|nr:sigma-54 dependent transcriptional regulator [Pyrinomonadaceae bacterium]